MRQRGPHVGLVTAALLLAGLNGACQQEEAPPPPLSATPTFEPKPGNQKPGASSLVVRPTTTRQQLAAGPAPPVTAGATTASTSAKPPPLPSGGVGAGLALEQVTLPQFINEVFGKTLRLNVQIDQAVMTRTDLVTMRTGRALSADELFAMAQNILAGYGLAASWDGQVLRVASSDQLMSQMPTLVRSRALPEIPKALRPVFQFVDLNQVSATEMNSWLTNAYGNKLKLFPSPRTNSVMIFGLPENVAAAVEAARVLDQPRLAGRQSLQVNPVYWSASGFAAKLSEVLRAEGYDAGTPASGPGPAAAAPPAIMVVPVEANNSVLAFAADPVVLAHIRRWASDLDKPGQADPNRNIFVYLVQNTTAASLGNTVQNVLHGGQGGQARATPEVRLEQAGRTQLNQTTGQGLGTAGRLPGTAPGGAAPPGTAAQPAAAPTGTPEATGPRLVIDQARNALILIGTAQDYEQIRPLLEAMDRAPREALIEVTVVELDLSNSQNLGVEFTLRNSLGAGLFERLGTGTNVLPQSTTSTGSTSSSSNSSGGLPIGSAGFNLAILNRASDPRLLLNAFAQNSRITVLSTPRVLAESGGEARIEVGTEVPIVTSQGTTNTIQNAGTSGILQSIEYRKTGVLLSVRPVVHSGDRIDLAVSQEVSQALPNTTPGISSPLIQNRNVSTQVTLSDGQTVVIGGLIAEDRSNADSGIPFLKDIPGVGTLFRNQSTSKTRTELLVFITPYVISDESDSSRITQQFREQMQRWPVPTGRLHW